MSAVQQSDTSIEVNWMSPGSPATGYIIYYQSDGGDVRSETISGVDTESYILSNLESRVKYSISIIAVSDYLPSAVVGPVRPSVLTLFCNECKVCSKSVNVHSSMNYNVFYSQSFQ